jgi:LacI family transcriptional regulator
MSITFKQIAAEAAVSEMTVSRVMRGIGRISPATRQRVRDAAVRLGYKGFDAVAFQRPVRRGSAGFQLRVLVPHFGTDHIDGPLRNRYGQRFMEGLTQRMNEIDGVLDMDVFDTVDDLLQWLTTQPRYHGIVLRQAIPEPALRRIQSQAPVVTADMRDAQMGLDSITTNENRAAVMVLRQLRAHRHEHICWFGVIDRHSPTQRWVNEAARSGDDDPSIEVAHGLRHGAWANLAYCQPPELRMPMVFKVRDWDVASLAQVVREGAVEILAMTPRPTAIVVSTVAMATELVLALKDLGAPVPSEMSVVAYGNVSDASQHATPITCVDVPLVTIGRAVPELVQRRQVDPNAPVLSITIEAGWYAGETLVKPSR